MRMARKFHIPFFSCLLVFSGRYLTMAHSSALSVQLFGRGWWEGVRSNGGGGMGILDRCVKAAHTQRSHLALSADLGPLFWNMVKRKKFKQSQLPQVLLSSFYFTSLWTPLIAQLVKNPPAMQETPVQFLGWGRSPGEGIGYPLQYSWASLIAQLVKNPPTMWETWVQSLGWEDPLEKGKATYSSILA